jgi:hypothetical protein
MFFSMFSTTLEELYRAVNTPGELNARVRLEERIDMIRAAAIPPPLEMVEPRFSVTDRVERGTVPCRG